MKKVLLVGAGGRLGQSLMRAMLDKGYQLVTFSTKLPTGRISDLEKFQVDWNDLKPPIIKDIDVVIHLAHQTSAYLAAQQVERDIMSNLVSTVRLVEALREGGNQPHFIYTGSLTEYGSSNLNPVLSSTLKPQPETFYDVSKITVESYLEQYVREESLSALSIIRIANLYGFTSNFRRPHRGFLDNAIYRAFHGSDLECYGHGNFIRDFIHVKDVNRAIFKIVELTKLHGSEIYNIGTGVGTSIRESLDLIIEELEIVGKPRIKLIFKDFPENSYSIEKRNHIADISKISRVIDWKPNISIREGISASIKELLQSESSKD